MSKPLSIGVRVLAGCAALHVVEPGSTAVSIEADLVRSASAGIASALEQSFALFGDKAEAMSKLDALVEECSAPGWDGADAEPISESARRNAEALIRAIPEGVAMPEFAPEPDGAISMDWIASKHTFLSISVGPALRLPFAWVDGDESGYAVAHFDGREIPTRLIREIKSISQHRDARVRTS